MPPKIPPSSARKPECSLGAAVWLTAALAFQLARADVGIQAGAQAGAALGGDVDSYFGFDLRLTAPGSPLAIQPTFDYVLDEHQTLYHIGGNVLYEAPVAFRLKPFLGIGANLSAFTLDQESRTGDSEGYRLGMNLVAGARLALPWLSPFFRMTQGIGEFDAFAAGGGVELALRRTGGSPSAPEPTRFALAPYLANNAFGDVQAGRVGLGIALAYFPWERFGLELDGQLHGHFFRDEDFSVAEGVDHNTIAALVSASGVFRSCASSPVYGTWCPYASAGVGAIHAWFDAASHTPDVASISETQTDPALTAGVGIVQQFTRHVGFRLDARYFHAFVAGNAEEGGYFRDYGFLRLSPGLAFGF